MTGFRGYREPVDPRSARGLTDGAGALVGTRDYAAFGAIRSTTGVGSRFGYAGEQTDATGFVHLRARQYDPTTGRFLSADSVQPGGPGTQGYNRYAYVGNNPCSATDPSGHAYEVPGARLGGLLACIEDGAALVALGVAVIKILAPGKGKKPWRFPPAVYPVVGLVGAGIIALGVALILQCVGNYVNSIQSDSNADGPSDNGPAPGRDPVGPALPT